MNQYASVAAVTHTYDNNGILTGDGTWTFGYDAENRLTTATKTGVSASYLYDPFGRREQKTVGGMVTKYLLDGGAVEEEYNGLKRAARYVYAPGVDEPIYMERGANRYFYHFDGNGSVAALTGVAGAVSERYAYGPYGETSSTTSVGNPYRYTGRELDAETGLYYYRARYYSQVLGRFLQPDPIGYEDGLNLYAYVGNDPLNLLDPSGLLAREAATKAYGVYNSLASNLRSIAPSPTVKTAAEMRESAQYRSDIVNGTRGYAIATFSGASGGAVSGATLGAPILGAVFGGVAGSAAYLLEADKGVSGALIGASLGVASARFSKQLAGDVVGGAVGNALGGVEGGPIGSIAGSVAQSVVNKPGWGPAVIDIMKAGRAGVYGGVVTYGVENFLQTYVPSYPR